MLNISDNNRQINYDLDQYLQNFITKFKYALGNVQVIDSFCDFVLLLKTIFKYT